ncbi:hypothetical protein [Dactylosporangium darangshiense]|uniref:hypothetical protein n=1 Tax=Dactylosporangium darangshiense TaxID=579108 RepID=UPI00362A06DD
MTAWSDRLQRFVVTRYDDVVAVLQDPVAFSSAVVPQVPPADRDRLSDFTRLSARWLFFLDPPEHAPRRAPVARALSPRSVGHLASPVAELAAGLVATLPRPGFDVLADFAHPSRRGSSPACCASPARRRRSSWHTPGPWSGPTPRRATGPPAAPAWTRSPPSPPRCARRWTPRSRRPCGRHGARTTTSCPHTA